MGRFTHVASGKVREIFEYDDNHLLIVASDRISAYDVILSHPIPDKGRVLTALSQFWFRALDSICLHHYVAADLAALDVPEELWGRAMLCLKAEPIGIEFVVRGYLAGSAWREYRSTGTVGGNPFPSGLVESVALPEPVLTPTTKAAVGHDESVTEEEAAAIAGEGAFRKAKEHALRLYVAGSEIAARQGIIIADTKFEFGIHDGEVILIDEVLTPDSSRFWPAASYLPGGPQPSFDKQYVRDWLDSTGWDHTPPPPDLPGDVVHATARRYTEAYERITGRGWKDTRSSPDHSHSRSRPAPAGIAPPGRGGERAPGRTNGVERRGR